MKVIKAHQKYILNKHVLCANCKIYPPHIKLFLLYTQTIEYTEYNMVLYLNIIKIKFWIYLFCEFRFKNFLMCSLSSKAEPDIISFCVTSLSSIISWQTHRTLIYNSVLVRKITYTVERNKKQKLYIAESLQMIGDVLPAKVCCLK